MSSSGTHLDGAIDQMSRTTQEDLLVLGTVAGSTKGSAIVTSLYDGFGGWWGAEEEGDEAVFEPFTLGQ